MRFRHARWRDQMKPRPAEPDPSLRAGPL